MQKNKKKNELKFKEIKYCPDAEVVCSCGAKFKVGSTLPKINIEICSNCHPFYTGNQKLIDTSGMVDKFKNRLAKRNSIVDNKSRATKQEKQEK